MNREKLKARLVISEGKRLAAYLDTVGILTVGCGHNCQAVPIPGVVTVGDKIDDATCSALLDNDIDDTIALLDKKLPWWSTLDEVRQGVLVDMAFNMGVGTLLTFRNTLEAIQDGDYYRAAVGMRQSKWAHQVGHRAEKLAEIMETGIDT